LYAYLLSAWVNLITISHYVARRPSASDTSCYVIVSIDKVWTGNEIYWTLEQFVTTLHKSLSHPGSWSQSRSSLRCWVAASHGWRPLSSAFPNGHRPQLPVSHSSSQRLLRSCPVTNSPANPLNCTDWLSDKVKVTLRPTVSLGVRRPSGTRDQFFYLLEIFFRQLWVCYFVASSLTRGRICNLLLLLVLASVAPLGSESRGTQDHILLSQFLKLQPGGPGPRIYIPQEQGGPVILPGTGFPLCRLLRLAGLRWRYSNPPPHGKTDFTLSCV
jgi:hypothetical protein